MVLNDQLLQSGGDIRFIGLDRCEGVQSVLFRSIIGNILKGTISGRN